MRLTRGSLLRFVKGELSMKNFKEMLDKDLSSTFYNTNEFAQVKLIKYDGIVKEIPIIFDLEETKDRQQLASGDHAEGIYRQYIVIRVRLSDIEKEPRQNARFWIDNDIFKIVNVRNEYNELMIELERFDE